MQVIAAALATRDDLRRDWLKIHDLTNTVHPTALEVDQRVHYIHLLSTFTFIGRLFSKSEDIASRTVILGSTHRSLDQDHTKPFPNPTISATAKPQTAANLFDLRRHESLQRSSRRERT